jgi:ATP-dependent helicase/nuclease subunit A
MSDYLADDGAIDEREFTRRACDPHRSVVVEACAGSGKTWLLVGRIVRLLLAGAEPGEILAITFTRRAAQQMRERLLADLHDLAAADDATVAAFLRQRGLPAAEAAQSIGAARALYERVLTARVPLAIDTFHGWFWGLIARAPLGAGVPFAPTLLAQGERARADAWLHFTAALLRPEHAAERAAWERLIEQVGEEAARRLLMQLLGRRAEWWCFAGANEDAAVRRALAPLRAGAAHDPRTLLRTPEFGAAVQTLVDVWQAIAEPGQSVVDAIAAAQRWLSATGGGPARDFAGACAIVLTKQGQPREQLTPEAIAKKLPAPQRQALAQRYAQAHAFVAERLQTTRAALEVFRALRLNEAALACGRLLIGAYQQVKAQQQALDFTDLEWHAHRLLADPDNAAYMHARLDARYRHILLDEFQDTNPLQWQVLQSWLSAYDASDGRPTVFIVGDPKQSIYRFRRAEPRVFAAALELLARDYGAQHLRTNVTRRNARTVIDVLNATMPGANPLYQAQSTRAAEAGAFVLLPLVAPASAATRAPADAGSLRDVLTAPRAQRDNDARYREGRMLANEIAHWVGRVRVRDRGVERPARWSDAMLLVRRRTHLADYERALRDAGVPFVSDRSGGLLATLEADDLTALLGFLCAPYADLKLAHALRAPFFGCSDDDLIRLAALPGASWWERMRSLGADASPALARAHRLLEGWLELAGVLPVHDLLDRIYHEGDVRRRYAMVAPAALHAQVQANLDAFIELALALDAGRYPSLPRFIDELAGLKRHAVEEAPDEGAADTGDAVRVMTIHGAKGLEAEIVALADAHAVAREEGESVLVVWPPTAAAPEHVSVVARGAAARDAARGAWFAQEQAQREQEDWNLLYVAATRARQVLIVSGCATARAAAGNTWYARLQRAAALSLPAAAPQPPRGAPTLRTVRDFLPAPLPTGNIVPAAETEAIRLGRAWHALLELGTAAPAAAIARRHGLTAAQLELARAAADRVRAAPHLQRFFAAAGENEIELVAADGSVLRIDRVVELDDALWVLDYKWRILEPERADYEAQVRRYAAVLAQIRRDKPVRAALIDAQGTLIEVDTAAADGLGT